MLPVRLKSFSKGVRDEWDFIDAGDGGDDRQNPNDDMIGDGEAIREILKDNL